MSDFDMSVYYENRFPMDTDLDYDADHIDDTEFECVDCAVIGGVCSDCITMED